MRTYLPVIVVVCLMVGCQSPEVKRDNYFKSGKKYLAEKKYEEATVEFRNTLRIDDDYAPAHLALGKLFQVTGDMASAIASYRKVAELDDKNVEARIQMGRYLLGVGSGDNPGLVRQAREMAEEVLKVDSANIEGRILLGNAYSGEGNSDKAIQELGAATSQDPNHLQAALSLGAAQVRNNESEKAEIVFRATLEKHPEAIEAHLTLATFLVSAKRNAEAEAYYRKAFDLDPINPKSLYPFATYYVSNKRLTDAEAVFQDSIKKRPNEREPRWGLANFYSQQGMATKSVDALLSLLKIFPGDRPAQLNLADLYLNGSDTKKAEPLILLLLEKNRSDAEAHQLLGRLFRSRNETGKALNEFDTALKLDNSLIPSHIEKANILLLNGDLDAAQRQLNAAQTLERDNLLVRGFLAKILALQQKPEDALQQARDVLASMPNNEDALVAQGDAFRSLGRLQESKKAFQNLLELRPGYPYYFQRLGSVEAELGETAPALLHLRKAVELKPDLMAAVRDLLLLLLKGKQYDAALAELDRLSQTVAPKDAIQLFRGQVYLAKGDAPSAESAFRKAIEFNPKNYQAFLYIAEIKLQRQNLPQAIKEMDALIARDAGFAPAFFLKGYYLELAGDAPGALASYRKARGLDPENPLINNNIAWLLSESEDGLDEALSLAIKARQKAPDDVEVADTLGWIYYKTKNYAQAVEQLQFSVRNSIKPDAEHHNRLGLAYLAKGEIAAAKENLRKALLLNPSFQGADEARRIVQAR